MSLFDAHRITRGESPPAPGRIIVPAAGRSGMWGRRRRADSRVVRAPRPGAPGAVVVQVQRRRRMVLWAADLPQRIEPRHAGRGGGAAVVLLPGRRAVRPAGRSLL